MKKIYYLFLCFISLSAVSCSNDIVNTPEPQIIGAELTSDEYKTLIALKSSHRVSLEKARSLAEQAASVFCFDNPTKAIGRAISDISVVTSLATKGNDTDTMFYIFNYADDKGCVIISADERSEGILAFIENGNINIGDSINNGAYLLLSNIENYQQAKIKEYEHLKDSLGGEVSTKFVRQGNIDHVVTKTVGAMYPTETIAPMIQTTWKQGDPFNFSAPLINGQRCISGCTTIAVAQLVAHYNYPKSYNNINLNLGILRTKKDGSVFTTDQKKGLIGDYIRVIGDLCNNEWGVTATGASLEEARDALRALGYNTPWDPQDCSYSRLKESLDLGRPVLISGYATRTTKPNWIFPDTYNYSNGHTWLMDGHAKTVVIAHGVDANGNSIFHEVVQDYLHCNFGWGGLSDGYYINGLFDTNAGPVPTMKSGEPYNYQYNLKSYSNIRIQ